MDVQPLTDSLFDDVFGLSPIFALDDTELEVRDNIEDELMPWEFLNSPGLLSSLVGDILESQSSDIQQPSETRVNETPPRTEMVEATNNVTEATRARRSRAPRTYVS